MEQPTASSATSDVHVLELLWLRLATAAFAGEGHVAIFDHEAAGRYAVVIDRIIWRLKSHDDSSGP